MELTISKKTYMPSAYVVCGLNYSVVLGCDFLEGHMQLWTLVLKP